MQDSKRRAILYAIVSLILAALAGVLFMHRVSAVEAQLGNEVTIYVAKTDIQPRQPLKPEQFEAVQVPQKFVQQSTVTNLQGDGDDGIEDYVTIVPLKKGDVLTTNLLKPATELGTEGDKRLVYVPASDRIVFDQPLEARDRVDIIVSWGEEAEGSKRTVIFKTDVLVAAKSGEDGKFSGVWLEMSLDEAKRFIDAQNFAASVRLLKAPQQESNSKVTINQEVPVKVKDPNKKDQGNQQSPNGEGTNLLPSNLGESQLDLD